MTRHKHLEPLSAPIHNLRPGGSLDLDRRLDALDVSLFEYIDSQTSLGDRRSLLALHRGCREAYGHFPYLEIGSHLGGSLQALIADPRCTAITSIDPRPARQPDARGRVFDYPENSTERMLACLRRVPGAELDKLQTIESDTGELGPAAIVVTPRLCFIDGEHTHDAALRDAMFVARLMGDAGAIAFHDRSEVATAIWAFLGKLERPYAAYPMPDRLFVVELGGPRLAPLPWIRRLVSRPSDRLWWRVNANGSGRRARLLTLGLVARNAAGMARRAAIEGLARRGASNDAR